jgi:hypothetical protein
MGEDSAVARYAAEFVGTFMLVFTIGCNVLSGQPVWGGTDVFLSSGFWRYVSLATALIFDIRELKLKMRCGMWAMRAHAVSCVMRAHADIGLWILNT